MKYILKKQKNKIIMILVLYKHYDELQNIKLGCIRLDDKFLNTFDKVKELSKGKI